MAEIKHLRISDANDPDRSTKFTAAIARSAADGNSVIRELIDAYIRYVDHEGCGPAFPVEIVSARAGKKKA